ncbi:hypothetical protein [Amycolatopsis sp. NPDC003861]
MYCNLVTDRASASFTGVHGCGDRARGPISSTAGEPPNATVLILALFGGKAALAEAVFDVVVAGDDEPGPVAARPEAAAVFAAPGADEDPPVRRGVRPAAGALGEGVDPYPRRPARRRVARTRVCPARRGGLTGMIALAQQLLPHLRGGLDADEVRNVLWNYGAIDHYERLVLNLT